MYIVTPIEVTSSNSTTNLVNDYPDWTAGTYTLGTRRVVDDSVYEVVASSTTDEPTAGASADPATWIRVGYSNEWRLFTLAKDSKSTVSGNMNLSFTFGEATDTVALLGVVGASVYLKVDSAIDGVVYEETIDSSYIDVDNYFDWFFAPYEVREDFIFFNLPSYQDATITITINSSGDAQCGRFIAGNSYQIGETLYGSTTGTQSFTSRERDGFGNLTIVPRRSIDVTEFKVMIETPSIPAIKRRIAQSSSSPCLFFATPDDEGLINFGLAEDFRIPYELPSASKATIEVKSI